MQRAQARVLGVNQQSTEENAAAFGVGVIQGKHGQQKYTKKYTSSVAS